MNAPVDNSALPFSTEPPLTENEKLLAGLSWVSQVLVPGVLPVILLLTDESKRSACVKRHAVQSLALMVTAVVYEILLAIICAVALSVAPCATCLLWVLFLLPIVPLVVYGVRAFQGKDFEIPYLTKLLRDNHWL